MKSAKCFVLCLCTVAFLFTTACNVTRSANDLNPALSDGTSSSVSSGTNSISVSSDTKTGSNGGVSLPERQTVLGQKNGSSTNERDIPYRNLYAGFIEDKNQTLPIDDILINSQNEWGVFKEKYLQDSIDVDFSYSSPIDFKDDSILYHSQLSAKEDVFSSALPIDKVVIEDNRPVLYEKDFDSGFRITTTRRRYVILVLLEKSDLIKK